MDRKSIYVCKSNKFASYRPCPGATGCSYEEKGDRYTCDVGSASLAKNSPAPAKPTAKGKSAK